ncbi:MAG: hypothetical protein AB1749_09500 [Pseudomonadota bacterium]
MAFSIGAKPSPHAGGDASVAPREAMMAPTKVIAGLMGPLALAIGIAMLVNRQAISGMAGEIGRNTGLIFLSGILLLAGIAIVRVHNVWSGGWPVLVTVIGWLAVAGGLLRMWMPQLAAPIADRLGADATSIASAGVVLLALGAFLSYKAYGPSP